MNKMQSFLKKALQLRVSYYGKDSSKTAIGYNNLGRCYEESRNLKPALELYFKALNIWKENERCRRL